MEVSLPVHVRVREEGGKGKGDRGRREEMGMEVGIGGMEGEGR